MSLPPRRVKSMSHSSSRVAAVALAFLSLVAAVLAKAADPPSCRAVRISDVGWTDVTSTSALFSELVRQLGYDSQVTVLSIPVTFTSMKNKDIDVFLGNWMPTMEADRKPYLEDHSIDVIGVNLTGAKYTLAVPAYTYAAGLRTFDDIQRFAPQLNDAIYGIEPGNDGNRLILGMIKQNQFNLGGFRLVESSEQGMLAEVERAIRNHRPIVFLGWEPHPMNMRFNMRYLTGGDAVFGPNFGGATIYTDVRAGYVQECPNIGRLLRNLKFTLAGENQMMDAILNQHQPPEVAARAWLKANPKAVSVWLDGVTTFDGHPALAALRNHGDSSSGIDFEHWMSDHKIPIGNAVAATIEYVKGHGRSVFDGVSTVIRGSVDGLTAALRVIPSPILIVAVGVLAWFLRRSVALALFVVAALIFIINQGYWQATLETLSLVMVAAFFSAAFGGARSDADVAHVRVPDSDTGAVWIGRGPRFDLHCHIRTPRSHSAHPSRHLIGAHGAAGSGRGLWRNPRPDVVESRVAERRPHHCGGHHPMHHAEPVHGRHCGPGRRRRSRCARGEGPQYRAGGHGVRGRIRHCVVGHYSRSHQPPG
jgi:glycine betaine/proline transport system substrate-binding protein